MKRFMLALSSVCCLSLLGADKPDPEAIQGTWIVAACELEAKLLPLSAFKELRYGLHKEGKWTLEGGPGFPKAKGGTYTLNPKEKLKTVDLVPQDGEFKGKTFQGIYQLEGDEMKMCFAFPSKQRPTSFTTQADSGHVLEFWRRIK